MNEPVNTTSKRSWRKTLLVVLVTLLAIAFFSLGACYLALYFGMKPKGPPIPEPPVREASKNYTPMPDASAKPDQP